MKATHFKTLFVVISDGLRSHRTISLFARSLLAMLLVGCAVTSALAQSPQVFVSARTGVDTGTCNVASPCRMVNYALTQVKVGGQVLIVDSGTYDSSISITKNVTIAAAPGVAAVFSVAAINGSIFGFNYPPSSCMKAGDCHTLVLRNLIFDGQGVTQDAMRTAGIRLLAEDCTFTGFRFGVLVIGSGRYQFKNCLFNFMETGVYLTPNTSGADAQYQTLAVVEDCRFAELTVSGIEIFTGPLGSNTLRAAVRDSLFNHVETAIRSDASTGGSIQVDVESCEITNNSAGLASLFTGSTVRVSNSVITGNVIGLLTDSGGLLLSRRNNTVENNNTNGAFTGIVTAK